MDAVVGTLLLTLATLLFGWAMVEFRRPNPSRWTRAESSALAIVFTAMTLLTFGGGILVRFSTAPGEQPLGIVEAALIGAILIAAWLGMRVLRARWKRLAATDQTVTEAQSKIAVFPLGPSDEGPDPGKRPPRSLGGGKRAGRRKAT